MHQRSDLTGDRRSDPTDDRRSDRTDDQRSDRASGESWHTRGFTTIVLEQNDRGEWRARQDGVPVTGRGETAQRAAADYCRRVAQCDD